MSRRDMDEIAGHVASGIFALGMSVHYSLQSAASARESCRRKNWADYYASCRRQCAQDTSDINLSKMMTAFARRGAELQRAA